MKTLKTLRVAQAPLRPIGAALKTLKTLRVAQASLRPVGAALKTLKTLRVAQASLRPVGAALKDPENPTRGPGTPETRRPSTEDPENPTRGPGAPENQVRNLARPGTPITEEWEDTVADIPVFDFDHTRCGPAVHIDENTTASQLFDLMFTPDLMEYLVNCTYAYGNNLARLNRPYTRNCRSKIFKETNVEEMKKNLGVSLL
ncbi:hypothetical protein O0L34_g17813 [Tuta absoluta]|nr:hypothetical protein O0L34_g17840 [Tuta absoluta]KAJ2937836.1 hypothetical protein O0L34_g17813 [Tuta absoluta]